ncbi:hnRNP A1-gamma isoform [Mycena belliarum]|uniref:HnRNP A1-gamma isoform n=1 Tax=Mycena belliarum TaxID=1033014 RepID=A0AAD6U689_9AGAR|nr:hnRNP A1-gamma isoform [Mycena belliae]
MSKATLDDLYGDIYGDDDTESAAPAEGPTPIAPTPDPQPATAPTHHNLPPKPGSLPASASLTQQQLQHQQNAAANAASLSYSAQIAQQFSKYQQTPSQERQQRSEMPPTRTQSTSAIPTLATQTFSISSSEDTVFGKKPSEMHDAGKMFIGGLNWDTTDEGLRNYFSEFGKVDACTIMRDPSGTSRGFAFMTFEDPASVQAVLGRDHFLDGKAIDPKRAIPREEHLRNTRYFVGGLSPATTSESMKEFFSAYGKVVDATVMVDRESSRSKGFGFVTFEDATNADQLVGKLGLTIDDKEIEVKMAQPRSQRDQGRMANGGGRDSATFNDRDSRTPPQTMTFVNPQMSMMFQRQMGQVPMMGAAGMGTGMGSGMASMGAGGMGAGGMGVGGMGMGVGGMGGGGMGGMGAGGMPMMGMNMNPMMMGMGGMGMNGFNPMAMGGMNMMGGGMGTMGNMGLGGMRMGMGGAGTGMGMGAMGMAGMRPGMMAGGMNPNLARMAMNTGGAGPARTSTRGQHNFHPYSR